MGACDIDELDASLTMLGGVVAAQAGLLLELENSPDRALVEPAGLRGATRAQAMDVVALLADIWRAFTVLHDVVEQGRRLRGRRHRIDSRALTELAELLHQESVPELLPRGPGLLPRGPGLLPRGPGRAAAPARRRIRPDELARRVDAAIVAVRGRLRQISAVRDALLAEVSAARRTLTELDALAGRLGLGPADAGLAIAHRLVDELSVTARHDPLGLPADLRARAEAAVAVALHSTRDLARRHDDLDADLRAADTLLAELVRLDGTARRDARRAADRIARPGPLYRLADGWLDDRHRGLAPWLDRLRGQAAAGRWKESSRGLSQWHAVAEATRETAARIADGNGSRLRRRDELRGLFGAWEAKAARLGLAADPGLAGRARAARQALFTAPADVDCAARLVDDYGAALASLAAPVTRRALPDVRPARALAARGDAVAGSGATAAGPAITGTTIGPGAVQ